MDFEYSPKTKDLQERLLKFMDEHIYPGEKDYAAEMEANTAAGKRWTPLQTIESSRSRPGSKACGTCSCPWTAPRPQATRAVA